MSLYIVFCSVTWLPLLLILSIPLLLLPLHFLIPKKTRPSLPPSPPKLPIIGHLHHIGELPHRSLRLLSQKYGSLMHLQLGRVSTLVLSSAEVAREALKSHEAAFCSRPALTPSKKLTYDFSDLAFSPYTDYTKEIRKIFSVHLLSPKRVKSFGFVREEEVVSVVRSIADRCSCIVNLSEMMDTLTHNILCRVAFGKKYEEGSEGEKKRFRGVLEETGKILGGVFVGDMWPWLWWVDVVSGMRGKLERCFVELDAFYERVIEDHLDPKRRRVEEEEDFVDFLLHSHKELLLSRDQVKSMLMNTLLAGIDTSAVVIVWAMAELVRKPTLMKKAQDEVRGILRKKGKVEETDLHQLQYLKSVIKEALRLHPPGPLFQRETTQHCNINGCEVFPKTRVYVNLFAIGRDPQSWENPDEFLPERFTNSSIDYKGHDFMLIPFGVGRRICPGMNFATITVELVLANLLYSFDWKLPDGMNNGDVDMSEAPGIIVHKKYPLLLVPSIYVDQKLEN